MRRWQGAEIGSSPRARGGARGQMQKISAGKFHCGQFTRSPRRRGSAEPGGMERSSAGVALTAAKEKPRRAAGLSSDGGALGLAKNRGPTRPNWGGGTKNVPLSRLPAPCKDAICALMRTRPRQTSFAEFKMLMTLDYEVLKRCGLPKSMVERALIKVYETVVLDQQRNRDHA